jgi:hypothetical protein
MFKRKQYKEIIKRVYEPRRFIQVIAGPRQTGKTTLVQQALDSISIPSHYASADEPALKGKFWIEQQWEIARMRLKSGRIHTKYLLALDEIQKIPGWSETVKRLWDEDTLSETDIHVIILGSAPLLLQQGLTESLAGRFEIIPVSHWSFDEMRAAFDLDIEQYIYFGGYPGSAALIHDQQRWSDYILNSLVETTLSRDILLMKRVDKPALLRQLFFLASSYSGQVLSYQKMVGQLQDAGNTTTLAHYLYLLNAAGLIKGIEKYAGQKVRQRASSPKLQVLNTALMTAGSALSLEKARENPEYWGRLVETTIGAHFANNIVGKNIGLFYWRERGKEVDFILKRNNELIAVEVKSTKKKSALPGMKVFSEKFKVKRNLLVGSQGIPLEEFFAISPESLFTV